MSIKTEQVEKFKKEIQKEELTPLGWEVYKGDNLLKMDLPETEFLVETLIPKEGITILGGSPSSCKSWLLQEIGKCVASNKDLFGKFKTKEAKVLYIDEEAPASETKRRWKLLEPAPVTMIDFMNLQGFKIDNSEHRKALHDLCDWRGYGLLIFDSLRDLWIGNENDSKETQILIDYFREFVRRGITILISHHHRKLDFLNSKEPSQLLRGSSVLLAGIDSLISIEKTKATDEIIELVITHARLRQGKAKAPFKVNLIETDGVVKFEWSKELEDEGQKIENAKIAVKNLLQDKEMFQAEIIAALVPYSFSPITIRRATEELKQDKQLVQRSGEKNRIYLRLSS